MPLSSPNTEPSLQPAPNGPLQSLGLNSATLKKWGPIGAIGVLAVFAGIVLPQFLSAPPAEVKPAEAKKADTKGKKGWDYTPPDWPEAPNHQAMFLRLGLGTIIVLGLCVGTVVLCKRWLGGVAAANAAGNTRLRRIETLALPQRCWIHLVHVGNNPVLVGGDAGGIRTIVPLPESFAATLLETAAPDSGPGENMATILAQRFTTTMDAERGRGERDLNEREREERERGGA